MPAQAGIQYTQASMKKHERRNYWIMRFRG
jgi:hypothetical protein